MTVKYVQRGDSIDYTSSSAVSAGDVVVQDDLVGVAKLGIAANTLGALAVSGVFDISKATGAGTAIAVGTFVYYDEAAKVVTEDDASGANKLIGITVKAAADDDTTARVLLVQGERDIAQAEATETGTDTAEATPSDTETGTDTDTADATPSGTDSETETETAEATPSDTASATETPTDTDTAEATPSATDTESDTAEATPSATPSETDTEEATAEATPSGTESETEAPETLIFRPAANDSVTWTPSVGTNYECVDDDVEDPDAPDSDNVSQPASGDDDYTVTQDVTFAGTSASIDIKTYAGAAQAYLQVDLYIAGGWRGAQMQFTEMAPAGYQWRTSNFVGTWTQAQVRAAKIRITSSNYGSPGDACYVRAVYGVVNKG